MPFDLESARKSGVSEQEIAEYLAAKTNLPKERLASLVQSGAPLKNLNELMAQRYHNLQIAQTALPALEKGKTIDDVLKAIEHPETLGSGDWGNLKRDVGTGWQGRLKRLDELGAGVTGLLGKVLPGAGEVSQRLRKQAEAREAAATILRPRDQGLGGKLVEGLAGLPLDVLMFMPASRAAGALGLASDVVPALADIGKLGPASATIGKALLSNTALGIGATEALGAPEGERTQRGIAGLTQGAALHYLGEKPWLARVPAGFAAGDRPSGQA